MSVAIVQGSSGALGLGLTRHILSHTSLKVYALTHRKSADLQTRITQDLDVPRDRFEVLEGVDVMQEDSLAAAAETVRGREGKSAVRLIACLAGVVRDPSSSICAFPSDALGRIAECGEIVGCCGREHGTRCVPDKHPRPSAHLQAFRPAHPLAKGFRRSSRDVERQGRPGERPGA